MTTLQLRVHEARVRTVEPVKRPVVLALIIAGAGLAAVATGSRTGDSASSTTSAPTSRSVGTSPASVKLLSEHDALRALRTPSAGPVNLLIDTGNQKTLLVRNRPGEYALSFQTTTEDSPLRGVEMRRLGQTLYVRGLNANIPADKWVNMTSYLSRVSRPSRDFVNVGGVFDFITWAGPTLDAQFEDVLDPVLGFTRIPASTCATAANLSPGRIPGAWELRCSEEFPPLVVEFDREGRLAVVTAGPTKAVFDYTPVEVRAPERTQVLSAQELKALGY